VDKKTVIDRWKSFPGIRREIPRRIAALGISNPIPNKREKIQKTGIEESSRLGLDDRVSFSKRTQDKRICIYAFNLKEQIASMILSFRRFSCSAFRFRRKTALTQCAEGQIRRSRRLDGVPFPILSGEFCLALPVWIIETRDKNNRRIQDKE
jgi:hypothetical protein